MRRARAPVAVGLAGLAAAILLAACAQLFDTATQCASDGDCAKFAGAVCDTAHGVCVASPDGGPVGPEGPAPEASSPLPDGSDFDQLSPPPPSACTLPNKPVVDVPVTNDSGQSIIAADTTLDCAKTWRMTGRVFVGAGVTLTIQAGTTVVFTPAPLAGLVVRPGARVVASGQKDLPVVFTSGAATPAAGDWFGLVVLGQAPTGGGQSPLDGDADLAYGGGAADDDSGVYTFVRVEYGAFGFAAAGVGTKTKIDSVEARVLTNDCFRFYGGAVDAKHLVCQFPGDELFEIGDLYTGRMQFLFGQNPPAGDEHHGFLTDASYPQVYNLTVCGSSQTDENYGVVVRDGSRLGLDDAIVQGWFGGFDVRDAPASPIDVEGSIFAGNAGNPAYAENDGEGDPNSPLFDDDDGFDEIGTFEDGSRGNATSDPGLAACGDPKNPQPWPAAPLTAGARTPPNDGFFDATAAYTGAFKDAGDKWMTGAWVKFDDH